MILDSSKHGEMQCACKTNTGKHTLLYTPTTHCFMSTERTLEATLLYLTPYTHKQAKGIPITTITCTPTCTRCRGCLDFNYEGDVDITKTNSLYCFLRPHNHQRNFICLWKLQGRGEELLEIMKRHWLVCADLIEWPARLGESGRSHEWEKWKSINC